MAVGTKNFPTSLDTVVELVEVTNDALTLLNGALTINATTITVDSTSLFPSSGIITIDSENISYTGKTATTFTGCVRAFESTTAATHADDATVELLITAALPIVHASSIIAIETKLGINSSAPSSGTVLRGTGAGASDWGAVVNADVSASAAIAVSKLAALTASRLPVLDASGFLSASSVTATEAGYLSGVTSAIQTQLDAKQATFGSQTANYVYAGPTSGGAATPSFRALVSGDLPSHNQAWSTITSTPTTLSGYGITDAAANGAVTASGLTMATARLLGRSTASTGAIEEITVGSGLSLSAGTLTATGGGITVGTTTITSGTAGRFLYETSGNVVGEISTLTSDGTIVTLSPTVTTGTGATSGLNANANSLTTGDAFNFASSSVSSGNVLKIAATGTAAASNTKTALNVATSGANATSTQTTYGAQISNISTGTTSTNIALNLSASGGTTNTALNVSAGQVLIPDGTSGAPAMAFSGNTGMGIFRASSWLNLQNTFIAVGGSAGGMFSLPSGYTLNWSGSTTTGNPGGSYDTGLIRHAAGIVRVNKGWDASTTAGGLVIGSSSATGLLGALVLEDVYLRRAAAANIAIEGASTTAGTISSPARTPSQITSNQNDYTPGVGMFQRWSSDASRNVTGLAAGQAGQIAFIWNVGSFDIVLVNESASSTAANRFTNSGGADITLTANRCAFAQYDATSSRWRAVLL